jgi:hypothetical protein
MSVEIKISGSGAKNTKNIRYERRQLERQLDRAAYFEQEAAMRRAEGEELGRLRAKNAAELERFREEQKIATKEGFKFWLMLIPVIFVTVSVICVVCMLVAGVFDKLQ